MDNKDLINLFFQCITLACVLGGGFFAFWKFASTRIDKHFEKLRDDFENHKTENQGKIDRVYKRMDEKGREFVLDSIYQLELKHQKEVVDQRFTALMDFMKMKFDNVEKTLEKLVKHDEDNHNGGNHG